MSMFVLWGPSPKRNSYERIYTIAKNIKYVYERQHNVKG